MGYRSFKDSTGKEWEVWDIVPQLGERRVGERRRVRQPISFRDRRRGDRRIVGVPRAVLAGGLSGGWLCFVSGTEKRRLIPIPDDWTRCQESQLEAYCEMARPVRRPAALTVTGTRPGDIASRA